MRILIIGGTSFIGPRVAQTLVDAGHNVTVFHRGQTNSPFLPRVNSIHGDRRDLLKFREEFKRLAPDSVVDMICYKEQDARDMLETFKGVAARTVTPSSGDVYRAYGCLLRLETGPVDPYPLNEESPLRLSRFPHRAIASSPEDFAATYDKIPVEQIMLSEPKLPGAILRLPAVYGPGDPHHRLFDYLKRMDDGRSQILLEENHARWRWTRGYVENVADAIALAATDERAASKIYNIGEAHAFAEAEWARRLGDAARWSGEIIAMPEQSLPAHLAAPYNYNHHLDVSTSRFREELGYSERVAPDAALSETISWERANPPELIDQSRFDYAAEDAALLGGDALGQ
jgi:nucleoside-diphosphate-sugar epimerase